jgi:hypothetical protein
MQSNPSTAVPTKQPPNFRLCAYAACGREFVPTNGHQYCKPECRQKARNALALDKYHEKRQLLEAGNKKQREEATKLALQGVHECEKCREVLDQLFRSTPSAIERYHRDVKASTAKAATSVQSEKRCECCGLLPVGTHGNSKLCIPCGVVHSGESKREGTRQYRSRQRGEAPVEEVRRCKDCGEILEPDPETGRVHGSKQYCDNCRKERDLQGKLDWKKNERAEARAEAGHDCPGKKIVDGLEHPCGEWVVPEKSMKQEFCSTECWARTYNILHPERREYYKNYATRLRERAWRPHDWENWDAEQKAVGIIMIENPGIKPRALGILLDQSRLPPVSGNTVVVVGKGISQVRGQGETGLIGSPNDWTETRF